MGKSNNLSEISQQVVYESGNISSEILSGSIAVLVSEVLKETRGEEIPCTETESMRAALTQGKL